MGNDRIINTSEYSGSIDQLDAEGIGGWFYNKILNKPLEFILYIDGVPIERIVPFLLRADLKSALSIEDVGFYYRFKTSMRDGKVHSINLKTVDNMVDIYPQAFRIELAIPSSGEINKAAEYHINNQKYFGSIDKIDETGIGGWLYDKLRKQPLPFILCIDDNEIQTIVPSTIRIDLVPVLPIANVGFSYKFQNEVLEGRIHYLRFKTLDGLEDIFPMPIPVDIDALANTAKATVNVPKSDEHGLERINVIDRSIYDNFNPLPLDLQGWGAQPELFSLLIESLRPATIIEVGTWKGLSALTMAYKLKSLDLKSRIICVDTWLGALEFWKEDSINAERDLHLRHGYPQVYFQFLSNVIHCHLEDYILPFPTTSTIAARYFVASDIKAELIYLDASHDYEDIAADLIAYAPLLMPGGVLFGDDYTEYWPGVCKAVDEFVEKNGLSLSVKDDKWIINSERFSL